MVVGFNPIAVNYISDIPVLNREFIDIKANRETGFSLKCVLDMIAIYKQIHRTEKYS